ncbi:galactose/glucose ABC transporter substrate-binding protein MglB [Oceanivirga salmonicida]|uniref:galactose/glucose ABC transporter substrate-binding protein MglB n=1 Tax=Oceanivirga salmonicida TaxID=1769291 RepID=UPI0008346D0C|nr:galactose/glucose ABC transporter substrate-binding protein MglB [Oceanivirga salmonicida]
MKKFLMSVVALSLLVFSCGEKQEKASEDGAMKSKIGVTIYKFDDNFMATFRDDLEAFAKEKSNVELFLNDSQNQQGIQNDQVDALIAKGVNVLAINLVDPSAGQTIVDKAKKANIPIVLFNKDPGLKVLQSYDKAYYVGNNPEESGVFQAEILVKNWKANPELDKNGDGIIQYAMLKGEPGHPDAEARTEYSIKTIEEKGIKTDKVFEDTGLWDAALAKDKVDAWLSSPNGSKIEVILANNDGMALGALQATKAHNVVLPIYGVDALQEAILLIESGELSGTVLNDGKNQAKAVLDLATNLAAGKDPLEGTNWKLVDKSVRVPYVGVDKENYKEFKK